MLEKETKSTERGEHGLMDRAMKQLHEKKGSQTFLRYGLLTQHVQNKDESDRLEYVTF